MNNWPPAPPLERFVSTHCTHITKEIWDMRTNIPLLVHKERYELNKSGTIASLTIYLPTTNLVASKVIYVYDEKNHIKTEVRYESNSSGDLILVSQDEWAWSKKGHLYERYKNTSLVETYQLQSDQHWLKTFLDDKGKSVRIEIVNSKGYILQIDDFLSHTNTYYTYEEFSNEVIQIHVIEENTINEDRGRAIKYYNEYDNNRLIAIKAGENLLKTFEYDHENGRLLEEASLLSDNRIIQKIKYLCN